MEILTDPYEQKLYSMFKSCDSNANGSLDESALLKLCKTLELRDKTDVLVKCLLADKRKDMVTFREFKDGLLKLLGNEMVEHHNCEQIASNQTVIDGESAIILNGELSPNREISPKLMIGTKKYGRRSKPKYSDSEDNSSQSDSDNENLAIHPSLTSAATAADKIKKVQRSSSQSDIQGSKRRRPTSGSKLKRCASLPSQKPRKDVNLKESQIQKINSSLDSLGDLDYTNLYDTFHSVWIKIGTVEKNYNLNRTELENVCKLVGLKQIATKMVDEVYDKLELKHDADVSFNNFIALIKNDSDIMNSDLHSSCHASSSSSSSSSSSESESDDNDDGEDGDGSVDEDAEKEDTCTIINDVHNSSNNNNNDSGNESTVVPAEVIVDMWESAGILNANNLLLSLGFSNEHVQISELSNTLDDELYSSISEEFEASPILRASSALHKAEVSALRQAIRQLGAENRKLSADNKNANNRIAMLAQEIDDNHASIEKSTKSEIKILDQKYGEQIREFTEQLSVERETIVNITKRFEHRIKHLESEDIRLKSELAVANEDKCALENEQISLQKQLTELLEQNINLNTELCELEEKFKGDEKMKTEKDNEEVLELIEKMSILQVENSNLRDKNDELTAEIEGLNFELIRSKSKKSSKIITDIDDNGNVLEIEPNQGNTATKRRGDSPSKVRVTEESPRLGKLRKCNGDDNTGTESETSGDWMALNSELCQTISTPNTTTSGISQDFSSLNKDDEVQALKDKIKALEKQCEDLKAGNNGPDKSSSEVEKLKSEKVALEIRCNELDLSLEQMRKEYEDCEDYWQTKLNEERILFEEEQRSSDEKFNELLRKMSEYEEQFATLDKDGRLTPIEENSKLEQQYVELESELDDVKMEAQKLLDQRNDEIESLRVKLGTLEKKLQAQTNINREILVNTTPPPHIKTPSDSPASSPISYLWSQSTIHKPARDYQNPNWRNSTVNCSDQATISVGDGFEDQLSGSITRTVSPIQKPNSPKNYDGNQNDGSSSDSASVASNKSFDTHSASSTYNVPSQLDRTQPPNINDTDGEIQHIRAEKLKLTEAIKDLYHQRDSLVMELQQLKEAKPVLEKDFAQRSNYQMTALRMQQLEQKNRHLQNSLKQQSQYVETIIHQSWQQQRAEINELRNRLETQNIILTEQAQRLTNADMLVKDLYVENSHLQATIQRLEQRSRGLMQIHQQGMNTMSGIP